MSFLARKDVVASIRKRVQNVHGKQYTTFEAYFGTNPFTKKAVRKYAKTEKRLKELIAVFYASLERGGTAEAALTPSQAYDAHQALALLAENKIKLSLIDCVKILLGRESSVEQAHQPAAVQTTGGAFEKYLEAVADKSELYQKDIRSRVGKWIAAVGPDTALASVTAAGVKTYLMESTYKSGDVGTWVSYNNHLGQIKTFMALCTNREQGFLAENPVEGMKKLVIPYRQPEYMKAEDVRKLFNLLWDRRDSQMWATDLAYSILSFFCGMRQSEIERVSLGESAIKINLEERFIRVGIPKGVSKGIRPRTFVIPEQAYAWMTAFGFMDAVVRKNERYRRHLTWAARDAKIKLPKNVGRHTFITMFEAVHHNPNALTAIVGNSDDVRSKCYNGVELKPEGEAYFKILPPEET